jgi:hypothetical protein
MAMDGSGYSLSDIAAISGDNGFGGSNAFVLILLFAMIFGWGGNGFGGNNFANAIGYENLATSNEVQRGFDNQNSMANEREILAAINSSAMQGMQNANQNTQYVTGAITDKYAELDRDIMGVGASVQQAIANQNDCCCSTKMLIQENASQQRYESAMQANATQQLINDKFAALEARDAQREIDALNRRIAEQDARINAMQTQSAIQQATAGVVRYPDSFSYNAGPNPFCSCNCGNGYQNI